MGDAIINNLRALSVEVRELTGDTVPRVPSLGPVEFLRDFVGPNLPVVITGAGAHWPALELWTKDYIIEAASGSLVTVALTPNGRADSPTPLPDSAGGGECFSLPAQRRAPLAMFFDVLAASQADAMAPVPYMQFQNSSLTVELPQLLSDVDPALPWATQAFGGPPDAVNLWIGGRGTITAWHRDHYENIYVMVRGRKAFRLLPPCDGHRMKLRRYPQATWTLEASENAGKSIKEPLSLAEEVKDCKFRLELEESGTQVLWSSVPPVPLGPAAIAQGLEEESYLNDGLPPPLLVTLGPGEALYLPACWWHEVHHLEDDLEPAVAVNYWHDMKFDGRYAATKAFEALAAAAGLNEAEVAAAGPEGSGSGDEELIN